MTIRDATHADSRVLAQLETACFDDAWTQATLETALADSKYLVLLAESSAETYGAEIGVNRVCGYALGWNIGEEADLARVAVLTARRGEGIGEQLTRALIAQFQQRGVTQIFLEVRAANLAAYRLYRRCGFEELGRRKEYYADGEDAIVMSLTLSISDSSINR